MPEKYELGYTPNNLKNIRQKHNLTQQQVADITETKSWRNVARWETPLGESDHADMPLAKWQNLLKNLQKKLKKALDLCPYKSYYAHIDSNEAASSLIGADNQANHLEVNKMTNLTQTYKISANNESGAYCDGGKATSLTAAVKKARATFGKGWKITIWLEDECVKSWTIRK